MADEKTGKALERLLKRLEKDGFEIGGDRLKTSPRGYDADHPRIHLLRCKQLIADKSYGFESDAIDAGLARPGARGLEDAAPAGQLAARGPGRLSLTANQVSLAADLDQLLDR